MMIHRGITVLVFIVWSVGVASAQPYTAEQRIDLRITGVLLAAGTPKREDVVTVDVSIQDKPMMLRLGKVEDLTTREKAQAVKDEVLLRQVRFTGAESLMSQLLKPEAVGKALLIEGWLNTKERLFQVTAVKDAADIVPAAK